MVDKAMNPVHKEKRTCPKCNGPISSNSLDLLCFICETEIEADRNITVCNWVIVLVFVCSLLWLVL